MLTERQQRDIAEFGPVYRQAQEEVTEATLADLRVEDPPLAAILDPESTDERTEETNRLTEQGVTDGDWEPLCDYLRDLGRSFAELGMSFADWFRLSSIYRPYLIPHLIAAHRDDEERLAAAVRGMGEYFDLALRTIGESYLANREERIAKHQQAIAELSTPVLRIRPGLLLLPIVGVLDSKRSRQLTEGLLYAVRDLRARVVVMDITGVAEVDTEVANRLVQTAEAARLMGAAPILTGISTGVAQTLVALGVDLKGIETVGDLQGGVELADRLLGDHRGAVPDGGR
jgi:rsbT co-antagonist protein RsbR